MRRLELSILGGIVIPVAYLVLFALVFTIVTAINGYPNGDSSWLWFITLPLEWSGHIYNRIFPPQYEKVFGELRGQVIWTNIISSFILYSLLTYAFLRWRNIPKRLP